MHWTMKVASAAFLPLVATAHAAKTDLVAPLGHVILMTPKASSQGGPKPYGATSAAPRWNIAQWGIPGENAVDGGLPPFSRRQENGATVLTTSSHGTSVKITRSAGNETVALSQNGAQLACLNPSGNPREADLFIQTNGGAVNGVGRAGFLRSGNNAIMLGHMKHLYQTVTTSITTRLVPTPKGCAINQAGVLTALVLQDRFAHPVQTLFYQFSFSNLCGPGTPARVRFCKSPPKRPGWFFRKNPFGVDDALPLVGQRLLQSGEARTIRLDLLPRLKTIIEHAPPGMDRDLSHWTVTGSYIGQHIWGDVVLQSKWSGYRLIAGTK
ncbi:MAG: hypothetical protein ACYCZB_17915 [Acidiphilium sp.]